MNKGKVAAGVAAAVVAAAIPIVSKFEGKVNRAYPDVVQGWKLATVCYGHTKGVQKGDVFTDSECEEFRNADLTSIYDDLADCLPIETMTINQQAAFLSLSYNGGARMVCVSSIPKKLKAGQFALACATISDFYKAGGKDCRIAANNCSGIIRRRAAERALCES